MRAAAAAAVLLAGLGPALCPAFGQGCPKGTIDVGNGQCARDMSRGPFMDMRGGHFKGARCPQGTHSVQSALGVRCVMGGGDGSQPVRGRGRRWRRGLDGEQRQRNPPVVQPAAPAQAPQESAAPAAVQPPLEKVLAADGSAAPPEPAPAGPPKRFAPFRAKGLALSLPQGWHVTDAWTDDVPTVYVELDARRRGKPVTMLVSKLVPGQEGYEPLPDAVAKEKADLGAQEVAGRAVSGLQARQTLVDGESRSAYVDAGGGVYYLLSYSAPKDVFSMYEPAFDRLLSSARFAVK